MTQKSVKIPTWLGYKEAMNKGGTGKCMIRVGDWKTHTGGREKRRFFLDIYTDRQTDRGSYKLRLE